MRRLVVLLVLLGAMLGIRALQLDTTSAHALTLAAIGFVVLAAFTISEMGSQVSLPRVTGYILAGVTLGPYAADILSKEVVGELKMFNALALGLIATGAGLELDLGQMRKMLRTLTYTTGAKIALALGFVGGTFYAFQSVFEPLNLESSQATLAMTLVVSALAVGTSPAISLAMMNELRAKGRVMDLVLGSAVFKDVIVVVCLAIALAGGQSLLGIAGDANVLASVSIELISSICAGVVLGGLLIAYIRFIKAEMFFFTAAMILVVSEIGRVLHLELLLVFIVAGIVVRNFSKHYHELLHAVETVALPVFVVFFTTAGAGINLQTTFRVLPIALALCSARAFAFFLAARWGAKMGNEPQKVRDVAWLGYLPQAGVTLGLVGMAANRLAPLKDEISSVGMAVVAINLLLGPILLRKALLIAGEVGGMKSDASTQSEAEEATASEECAIDGTQTASADEEAQAWRHALAKLSPDWLSAVIAQTLTETEEILIAHQKRLIERARAVVELVENSPNAAGEQAELQQRAAAVFEAESLSQIAREAFSSTRRILRQLPAVRAVGFTAADLQPAKGDSAALRFRKFRWRLARRVRKSSRWGERQLPVQTAVRAQVEPILVGAIVARTFSLYRLWAKLLEEIRLQARDRLGTEEVVASMNQLLERWQELCAIDSRRELANGVTAIVDVLSKLGTPQLPVGRLHGSVADAEVSRLLSELDADAPRWGEALAATVAEVLLVFRIEDARAAIGELVEHSMLQVISDGGAQLEGLVASVRDELASSLTPEGRKSRDDAAAAAACDTAFRQLEKVGAHVRGSASVHALSGEIRQLLEILPEKATLVVGAKALRSARRAKEVRLGQVFPRAHANSLLFELLLPALDGRVRHVIGLLAATSSVLRQCIDISALARVQSDSADEQAVSTRDALERALTRLDEHMRELSSCLEDSVVGGRKTVGEVLAKVDDFQEVSGPATSRGQSVQVYLQRAVHHVTREFAEQTRKQARVFRQALERVTGSQLGKDALLRVGSGTFDAASIREYTTRLVRERKVPADYARLFSAEPVREHRFFLAHHDELRQVVEAERSWLAGGPNAVLLMGAAGSGRTSLLNLCELELSSPRLLRPEPLGLRRDVGVMSALANELGVRARRQALTSHFRNNKAVVLIDDLEHWFTPNLHGVRDMTGLLDLIVETRESVFWIFAVQQHSLALLDEVLPLRRVIGRRIALQPLQSDALRELIETRHGLSGRPLSYQRGRGSTLRHRLRPGSDESVYFRVLSRVAQGNLGRAFEAWQRSVSLEADGSIRPHVPLLLNLSLPLARQLPPSTVAILLQLLRFGPFTERSFCELMMLKNDEIRRELHFLRDAGLLSDVTDVRDLVEISRPLRPFLVEMLQEGGVST